MFIHDRRKELGFQLAEIERSWKGDHSAAGPDFNYTVADIDAEGNFTGRRNWRLVERTRKGAQRFGITVRDSWIPFLGGTGGATLAVTGVNEGFSYMPEVPWILPALIGGLVGWKTGEWGNKATTKAITLISRPFRAFNERYYFKL